MANKPLLPKGYKALGDNTRFLGNLKNLSPAQQQVQRLMVRDRDIKNERDVHAKTTPPQHKLKRLSDNITNSIQAQTNLRKITPYIKRAEQIWTTLILKPNGLEQELLNFDTLDSNLKNAKLHSLLLQKVKNNFTNDYPFQDKLPQIIKDVMFRTGSYVLLNISYPALDHLINGMAEYEGTESFRNTIRTTESEVRKKFFVDGDYKRAKNTGWVRKEKVDDYGGLEAAFKGTSGGEEFKIVHDDLNFTVTDNLMVIKMAQTRSLLAEQRLSSQFGGESLDSAINTAFTKDSKKSKGKKPNANHVGITDVEKLDAFFERMYPDRKFDHHETLSIRHAQYYTGHGRGEGITFHVPSEACIPVHVNGEKNHPIGYFFLIDDKTGNFLKSTGDVMYYSSGKHAEENGSRPRSGSMNDVIQSIKNVADGVDCTIDMDWIVDFVNGQLEKELAESLLNGDKAVPVTVTLTEANKKIFLARAFKQQGVRSVFVPAEYVTYFALDYNDFGVGKSLVEEAKMIITRLAILDIADTMANLQNAIPKSLLTIDLEEENFSPQELIQEAREKYLQANPSLLNYVGFAEVPIDRIVDGIKESLVRVKVNANDNPNIINPNIEETQDNYEGLQPVDNDSREKALNSLASYFDLKRSWLEDSEQGNDFAIEALADQELLRNITIERSRMFSLHISDHFSKYLYANEHLMKDLIDIILENKALMNKPDQGIEGFEIEAGISEDDKDKLTDQKKVKMVLKDFISNLHVTLPVPASVETYNKLVDKLEAADKLVAGWKDIGVAESVLQRLLKQMGLEEGDETTSSEYIIGMLESVLRKEAYRKFGISIPFDEIVTDGKTGGVMTFINEAVSQRDNVVYFIENLLKQFSKGNKAIAKIGEKYKEGLFPEANNEEDEGGYSEDDQNDDNTDSGDDNTDFGGGDIDTNTEDNGEGSEDNSEENTDEDNPEPQEDENTAENAEEDLNKGLDFDGGNITF